MRSDFETLFGCESVTNRYRRLSAFGYEHRFAQYARVISYMRSLLWEGSCANTACPVAMQDGATRLLQRHLAGHQLNPVERKVFGNAFEHLVSRDPQRAWTSGQWMTERTGGSDVSKTETVAVYSPLPADALLCDPNEDIPLGPWLISGFKWFSSATDSNATILLAKTPKGLSAFYAPMRRYNPTMVTSAAGSKGGFELNGVTISRLKNKMGTKSLPTAELELKGMRGWLIGEAGQGIQEVATILTITRLRTATAALGVVSRSLAISRAFARVREVGAGKGRRVKLVDNQLHMRTLSDMMVTYHGLMLLNFFGTYIMGLDEHQVTQAPAPTQSVARITPPRTLIAPLLRVWSAISKAYCSKNSIALVYECMESLGGVGYLENSETEHLNVARLFRDVCVLSIWEGTSDVLSTEFIRALKHPNVGSESLSALDFVIRGGSEGHGSTKKVLEEWEAIRHRIENCSQDQLLSRAKDMLWRVAKVLIAVLYVVDSRNDPSQPIGEMCRRFLVKEGFADNEASALNPKEELEANQSIVLGPSWAMTPLESPSDSRL
jgi:alkylation response protein AidB-like acyl-CoA dehydrogenase